MIDKIEKQKRTYEISLLLRKKSVNYILQFVAQNWGLRKRQAYNYIRLAREEWKKYFAKLKIDGMSYHVAQLRDLKDNAHDKEDYRLIFDIAKEEAKLMGIYPAEGHKVEHVIHKLIDTDISGYPRQDEDDSNSKKKRG